PVAWVLGAGVTVSATVLATVLTAVVLAGPAGAVSPPATVASCPTLAEWNSETHDGVPHGPVPDVMGMTRGNAAAALAQGGFDTEASAGEAAGDWTVTDQTPTSEEQAPCGSTVVLDLAAPVTYVDVPDVVGDPLDQAEQEIRDLGLVSSVTEG